MSEHTVIEPHVEQWADGERGRTRAATTDYDRGFADGWHAALREVHKMLDREGRR